MMHGFIMFPFGIFFILFLIWIAVFGFRRLYYNNSIRGKNGEKSIRKTVAPEIAIYRLAKKKGGRLQVSDVVVHMAVPPKEAEELLVSQSDGNRVSMEVNAEGRMFFVFHELQDSLDDNHTV